jgi:hypothetical protein
MITVALFGSASSDTEFEISYLNAADPNPPDSLVDEPVYESTDVISLDDSLISINGKEITVLKDMTVGDFISTIYAEGDYTFALYDENGEEITDMTRSVLYAVRLAVLKGAEEADSYTIINGTGSAPGEDDGGQVDTGDVLPAALFAAVLAAGALLVLSRRRTAR